MLQKYWLIPVLGIAGLLMGDCVVRAQQHGGGGGGHSGGGHSAGGVGSLGYAAGSYGSGGHHGSGYIGGGYGRHHGGANLGAGYLGGVYIGGGYIGGIPYVGGFSGGYGPVASYLPSAPAAYPSMNPYPNSANESAPAAPVYYALPARNSGGAAGFGVMPADGPLPAAEGPAPAQDGAANIEVILPDPQARVWFDGTLTRETGTDRQFTTPSLTTSGTYRIRASWTEAGREVIQEKVVNVTPNQTTVVDFTRPVGG